MNPVIRSLLAVLAGLLLTATSALVAGEQTGGKTVNGTGCECVSRECCLCVDETQDNALQVKLEHKTAGHADCTYKVWLIDCAAAPGPRFDGPTGPQFKPIDCDGCWHCFKLWGGKTAGRYKVLIESKCPDLKATCDECGTFCVYDTKNFGPFDSSGLWGPRQPPPNTAPFGFGWSGAICGTSVHPTPVAGRPGFGTLANYGGKNLLVYMGIEVGGAGSGTNLIATKTDDCGDRLEMYCMPVGTSSQFRLYYVDCHGNSYHIGSCEWDNASNDVKVEIARCGSEKRFARITFTNSETVAPNRRNVYVFDTCTLKLDAKCVTNGPNKQVQFTTGTSDPRFAPATLNPRAATPSPQAAPPPPMMPPCPKC